MHKQLFRLLLLLTISLAVFCISSCAKLTENPDIANALVGQWRFSNTSVNLTVDGEDLIQYLTSVFEYNQVEAETVSDSIVAIVKQNFSGTILFKGDQSYQLKIDNQGEEDGNWLVNADGQILVLTKMSEKDSISIQTITAQKLMLKLPVEYENADFNQDGEFESILEINTEVGLSKSSNGGAGG